MEYEFYPIIFGLILIFGFLAFGLFRKFLREAKDLKLKEMAHRERMKAMEKDVPLPEHPPEGAQPEAEVANGSQISELGIQWFRLTALCVGLLGFFAGVGMCLAFALARDPELTKIWSIGLIPAMGGVGFLLFYAMSRSFDSRLQEGL